MRVSPIVAVSLGVLAAATSVRSQERVTSLRTLAADLKLTGSGVRGWLNELGVAEDRQNTERLLVVNLRGQVVLARDGDDSKVRFDAEIEALLRAPAERVVLIHNHPANVGLSAADLRQLTKPAVAAIVAIGHDTSVFIASASAALDRELFLDSQYAPARDAVVKGLQAEWPSAGVSVAAGKAHFSHLVTLALARAGVVDYWFKLQGNGRESFDSRRLPFARVVGHAVVGLTHKH